LTNKGTIIGLLLAASLGFVTIAGFSSSAFALSAVVAYLPSAEAGQGPHYITFDSIGKCHQFVKDNADLYAKDDCQKGLPPEEPPAEG
jgi:hypothetical protein